MVTGMDNQSKCCRNQTVFPHDPAQSKILNKANPKNDSSAYGPRDDEGILAAVPPE